MVTHIDPSSDDEGAPMIDSMISAYLQNVFNRARGNLTVERIVQAAAPETSPLHALFEWDQAKAAHHFNHEQARSLVRRVTVKVEHLGPLVRVPAFVKNPRSIDAYSPVLKLRDNRTLAHQALLRELGTVRSALERARAIAVGLGLNDEIDVLLGEVVDVIESKHHRRRA